MLTVAEDFIASVFTFWPTTIRRPRTKTWLSSRLSMRVALCFLQPWLWDVPSLSNLFSGQPWRHWNLCCHSYRGWLLQYVSTVSCNYAFVPACIYIEISFGFHSLMILVHYCWTLSYVLVVCVSKCVCHQQLSLSWYTWFNTSFHPTKGIPVSAMF